MNFVPLNAALAGLKGWAGLNGGPEKAGFSGENMLLLDVAWKDGAEWW